MAGHLKTHPYYKTFDEAQRSEKRMRTYLDMNWMLLSDEEKEKIQIMIEALQKAVQQVPEDYQITRHFQR
jgi:uncharacterized protein YsxB (DUF464 family)